MSSATTTESRADVFVGDILIGRIVEQPAPPQTRFFYTPRDGAPTRDFANTEALRAWLTEQGCSGVEIRPERSWRDHP